MDDGGRIETIYALATAAPTRRAGAGIAVIRVSGPRATDAFVFLTERGAWDRGHSVRDPSIPQPRLPVRRSIHDPVTGEVVDHGLAVWFAAPRSYTGEDVVEFHIHGGRATIAGVLRAIGALPFCRMAEPGEFTRRAFERGKLDLTAAEGVADLVAAETAAQRRLALRQLDGALGQLYEGWRTLLLRTLAHLEADIDFPDEDLPAGVAAAVRPELERLRASIAAHLGDRRGERLRDGVSIAIIGPPNAGKSSLLNAIARRDAAIVSATAGTTRDVIETHLDLDGYPVILADTAGLRDSDDPVELEGVRRARARAGEADIRLLVVEAADAAGSGAGWRQVADDLRDAAGGWTPGVDLVVVNKIDLLSEDATLIGPRDGGRPGWVGVSALTGEGMAALLDRLGESVAGLMGDVGAAAGDIAEAQPLTRARHREALTRCVAALDRALARAAAAAEGELVAEDVRLAAREIGRITGRVGVEDVLGIVFRDFCIGK